MRKASSSRFSAGRDKGWLDWIFGTVPAPPPQPVAHRLPAPSAIIQSPHDIELDRQNKYLASQHATLLSRNEYLERELAKVPAMLERAKESAARRARDAGAVLCQQEGLETRAARLRERGDVPEVPRDR